MKTVSSLASYLNPQRLQSRSGEHLTSVIDDLPDVTKIESGRITIQNVPCNLAAVVHDVKEMQRLRAAERDLGPFVELSNFPASVRTDPAQLRQVLTNLLSNAITYTDQGLRALREALIALDGPRISVAIDRISHTDARLRSILISKSSRFAYTAIGDALELAKPDVPVVNNRRVVAE